MPHWARVRRLCFAKGFFNMPMLQIRAAIVQAQGEAWDRERRHALMLASMFVRDCTDPSTKDPASREALAALRIRAKPFLERGMRAAMTGGGDLPAIRAIQESAVTLGIKDFIDDLGSEARGWFLTQMRAAIKYKQPLERIAKLAECTWKVHGVNAAQILEPVLEDLATLCTKPPLQPEHVNQVAVFRRALATPFDEALFSAIKPMYLSALTEGGDGLNKVNEWMVAYCMHSGAELPQYCMGKDQREVYTNLHEAALAGDKEKLREAVVAAKLVPDLHGHPELEAEFTKAIETLRREARLPLGWDLEDLLGTEKMFKKADLSDDDQLALFQKLLDSTHQTHWTRDRAKRGGGAAIADKFKLKRVVEIQNGTSWQNYDHRRSQIIGECCPPGREAFAPISDEQWDEWSGDIITAELGKEIVDACKLSPLEPRCNEYLFFHGTNPKVADLIAENHFDISFASAQGLFGAGLYFAESCSKSDEYVGRNSSYEYPILVVRVVLGRPNYIDQRKPWEDPGRREMENSCKTGTYHSVLGDRIKASGTYREFVVYDHFQAYPHFILWYKRKG
eukprot:gnl/TRDRNA2_/TRDRNA2_120511_c1_seq2.p1 gnl/TRDRNA2_/TRDRNA2_120511_c1~~gnl/TRDRNA2_/TRDRNA2_120511_c1_seq2.p1  ORF type:complete len:608 (+),score=115.97 gnl/TRDRNA2_/TRDRNA2_120511_c1_seq2:130-1824(+)